MVYTRVTETQSKWKSQDFETCDFRWTSTECPVRQNKELETVVTASD